MKRIVTTAFLLLSIYMLPWWMTFIAVCIAFAFFNMYVEGVIVAIVLDWLYAPNFIYFSGFHSVPILALILCIFVPIIKNRLLM